MTTTNPAGRGDVGAYDDDGKIIASHQSATSNTGLTVTRSDNGAAYVFRLGPRNVGGEMSHRAHKLRISDGEAVALAEEILSTHRSY
jgi:hypothetical protein